MDDRGEQLEELGRRLRAELARKDAASRPTIRAAVRPRPATTQSARVLTAGRTTSGSPTSGFLTLVGAAFLIWWVFLRGPSAASPAPAAVVPPPAVVATTRPAPATLLSLQGNGIKTSKPFTATGAWSLEYDFNCTSFGMAGNFAVTVYDAGGNLRSVAVNELAMRGHDTTQGYETGALYLDMNSECSWSVLVTG